MEENMIKVYVQVDSNNIVIKINSGIFIADTTDWIQIDEGTGDKYSHAQGSYLEKGLLTDGKYNYKLVDGVLIELADEEKINIDELKQIKINELSNKCNEVITKEFYSAVDGTNKLYDFELENQINMSTKAYQIQISRLAGQPIETVSYYAKGEICHEYTADQFLQLAQEGEAWKTSNIQKYKDVLKPMVEACTTTDEVNAITWDSVSI